MARAPLGLRFRDARAAPARGGVWPNRADAISRVSRPAPCVRPRRARPVLAIRRRDEIARIAALRWVRRARGRRRVGARAPRASTRREARTQSARSGCADRHSPSAATPPAPPDRSEVKTTFGPPLGIWILGSWELGVLLMNGAGVDDRLRGLLTAEHNEEVAHHGSLALLVQLHDALVREHFEGHLHHAHRAFDDALARGDDG